MEGVLRKCVEDVKLFQTKQFPKRYFIIDFTSANIYITHERTFGKHYDRETQKYTVKPTGELLSDPDIKVIPFRSVQDVYLPNVVTMKRNMPSNWYFPFTLDTIDRKFLLFTKTSDERKMWIAGFRYVIASTVTV